jgi:sugar (pentulose or hexulose) kinase
LTEKSSDIRHLALMGYVVGVDVGSQSVKALLAAEVGR